MIVVSIFNHNQHRQVAQLAKSVARWHPEAIFWAVLLDEIKSKYAFNVLSVSDLGIKNFDQLTLKYRVDELNGVVKTQAIKHFLGQAEAVVFLDANLQLANPLTSILNALENHDLVLLPKLTQPFGQQTKTAEQEALKTGIFRTDCLAIKNTPASLLFANWWADRTLQNGQIDYQTGHGGAQLWVVHALGLAQNLFVCRENTKDFLKVSPIIKPQSVYGQPLPFRLFGKHQNAVVGILKKIVRLIENYNPAFLQRN